MISVCLASYNGEQYLAKQIESILKQLGTHDELIISDDGSRDGTMAIISSFDDQRIRLFPNNSQNLISNFENALKQARGEFIFLSDQDDIWVDGKVTKFMEYLTAGCDLAVSDCKLVSNNEEVLSPSYFMIRKPKKGLLNNIYKNSFMGSCMAFRRKVLDTALPFPKGIPMHDMWIGVVAQSIGNVEFINEPLLLYRRHSEALSSTGQKSQRSLSKKLKGRWVILSSLYNRLYGKTSQ